ncbi:MAG: 2,3-bisphosphoglycerate-independent phosphoglycerate mutase [Myxococcota bacterium]
MESFELRPHREFNGVPGPVVVVVMDGVGQGRKDEGNAVWLAHTPQLDWFKNHALSCSLVAHGTAVGLPSEADVGNSEVGHNALGAGRVFDQGAKRINAAIRTGELFRGPVWNELLHRVRQSGEPLHFLGLLSDGNVHSHIDHLFALIRQADREAVARVRVHILLDGRDVSETSALSYVDALEKLLHSYRIAGRDYRIASGGGRMTITMDRYEADWAMVERGYRVHVEGEGRRFSTAREAIETYRAEQPGISDQHLPAFVIEAEGEPVGPIRDGASVVCFNFRGDRAIQISRAFEEDSLDAFARGPRRDILYAGMMQYDGDLLIPKRYLVLPPSIDRTTGEFMVHNQIPLFAISETQKYGHVTFFWNGNRSGRFDASYETYVEVPGDNSDFEMRPWMQAAEITDRCIAALESGRYRHLRLNYPNGDMVGHTGDRDAAILAVETVDLCLRRLAKVVHRLGGALLVTADHGNADEMFELDASGDFRTTAAGAAKPKTSHTRNRVPCHIFLPPGAAALRMRASEAGLSSVAATTFHLLGLQPPDEYEASLLVTR